MPVAFPSHLAAALPLHRGARGRLPLTALLVGTCAPDFAFLVHGCGLLSHTVPGLLLFGLPLGLLVLVPLERLMLPALARALPPRGLGLPLAALAREGARVGGLRRTAADWAWTALALVLGAATHVLWDGFTHPEQWPARVLYLHVTVPLPWRTLYLAELLHVLSTLVGAAAVWAWARRGRGGASDAGGSPGRPRALWRLLGAGLLLGAVALALRAAVPGAAGVLDGLWTGLTGAWTGLLVEAARQGREAVARGGPGVCSSAGP
jgi:hypothetical protein